MFGRKASGSLSSVLIVVGLALCGLLITYPTMAQAGGPVAQPPYTISVFALSQDGYSKPDSIVQWQHSILVGFGNGVAKDGSDGKSSTIVQYSLSGQVQRTFSVKGHNDGLRLQPGSNNLWALQNEDANPNLVIIDLETGQQTLYTFPPTPHGGGYDDMVFTKDRPDQPFMTASNPTLNGAGVNVFPALVRASLSGNTVNVVPVLYGNATATDIPTGATVTLNLTDPDSLTADPRGNIVLDSQADAELVFITPGQAVGRLSITPVPITVDDTAFASSPGDFLLVADLGGEAVYRVDSPTFGFEPGVAYSASDNTGIVATLNLDTGALTNIVTGLVSGRGMLFVSVHDGDD
jgi:hypothetical protein